MRRAITIAGELEQIHTIEELTGVFESIASIKIAKIRSRVVASKDFFSELWQTYRALRVDPREQLHRAARKKSGRNVLVAVTAEGKLSGDIDTQVIDEISQVYEAAHDTDVVVLGSRGANLLKQRGITATQTFHLPQSDTQFSVTDMIDLLGQYDQISVFYQTYESLRVQRVARIELVTAVRELGDEVEDDQTAETEIVSSQDFIFEPGSTEIADYLESLMMGVALTQVLMESKLAQYASRFNAMNAAKHRASELATEHGRQFYRAKRAEGDERLREVMKVARRHGR